LSYFNDSHILFPYIYTTREDLGHHQGTRTPLLYIGERQKCCLHRRGKARM